MNSIKQMYQQYIPHINMQWMHVHCKDEMPKIWNKYSQKRNIGASVPISTFTCLWANYIFPRWVCLFCRRKYVDRSWEYLNRSQTHECGNWGWDEAAQFSEKEYVNGIAVAVYETYGMYRQHSMLDTFWKTLQVWAKWYNYTLIKKKIKFSSYIG